MKIIINTLLLILCGVVSSHSQNVSEIDMQKIGQAMQETRGKANPKMLTDLFKKHLEQ